MNYFVLLNDERKGPYTLQELAEKYITADVMVWHEGMENWKKASEMPELASIIKELPPDPPHFKILKNWLTESIVATGGCALIAYVPIFQFCLIGIPFGVIGIIKALQVKEHLRKNKPEAARHYAEEARKWTIWCLFACVVGCIFAIISWVLLFTLGVFLWEKFPI